MFSMWNKVLVLVAAVLLQCATAADPAASTFFLNETGTTFAVNLPANSSDMYIHFSSPAYSWVAVGAGTKMAGSLMFVMYYSADEKNVTISPRIATGNNEPSFAPEIQISALPGTGITNDSFVLNALCKNCRTWRGGSLDLTTRSQAWMFAYGPDLDISSNSPSANLRRHDHIGFFTMDMLQAQGEAGVPVPQSKLDGAVLVGLGKDGDRAGLIHAAAMCFAIFILLPFKVAVSGLRARSRLNFIFGGMFLTFVLAAFGVGIYVSLEYNRSKHFSSAHQILGFFIIAAILLLFTHGIMIQPRRNSNQDQHQSVWTGQEYAQIKLPPPRAATAGIHTWGGRGLWIVAIINGGLGLQFASAPARTRVIYAIVVIAITLAMGVVYSCIWLKWKKQKMPKREDSEMILENYWHGNQHGQQRH